MKQLLWFTFGLVIALAAQTVAEDRKYADHYGTDGERLQILGNQYFFTDKTGQRTEGYFSSSRTSGDPC